jgi:hypothetical protein
VEAWRLPCVQLDCVVFCCAVPCCAVLCHAAIGRLEDDSQLVVKAALQLLCKMLHQGIFPPALDAQVCCTCETMHGWQMHVPVAASMMRHMLSASVMAPWV